MVNLGRVGDWYRPDPVHIRTFSREAQATRLLELLLGGMSERGKRT
jgi:hypothetical protein